MQIGPYALIQRLGAGGMAEVWLGRYEGLGGVSKTVAVKLLASQLAGGEAYHRMFMTEARLAMMMSHSNVVQVFDVGQVDGRLYMVMEWVDGLDFSRLLKHLRGEGVRLSPHVVAHVVEQMLRGLAYAHGLYEGGSRETIVHRDISPHNVLVSVSGEVKISDFGIARLASEETTGLHVRGKLRYMPPEQALGKSRAPTVDLFAVGAVMHEALSGRSFRGDIEPEQLFQAVVQCEMPPLERDDIPPELMEVLEGLLQPSRHERFGSAEQALAALHRWPGLRSASDELAALARRFSGIEAPRSGLSLESSPRRVASLRVATRPLEGDTAQDGSNAHDGPTSRSAAVSAAMASRSESARSTILRRQPRAAKRGIGVGRSFVMGGVVVAGLALGLAWSFGDRDARAGVFEPVQPVSGSSGERDAGERDGKRDVGAGETDAGETDGGESEPKATRVAGDASSRTESTEPTSVDVGSDTTERTPVVVDTKPKAARRMKVVLSSGVAHYVRARIGKREVDVEGSATIELAPGTYAISVRDGSGSWRSRGSIVVETGHAYRVEFGSAGAEVTERSL